VESSLRPYSIISSMPSKTKVHLSARLPKESACVGERRQSMRIRMIGMNLRLRLKRGVGL
jgi:hypothetical protein